MTVRIPAHGTEISHGKEIRSEHFRFEVRPPPRPMMLGARQAGVMRRAARRETRRASTRHCTLEVNLEKPGLCPF